MGIYPTRPLRLPKLGAENLVVDKCGQPYDLALVKIKILVENLT